MDPMTGARESPAVQEPAARRSLAGRWVTVHAPEGSYAAQRAPSALRVAERTAGILAGLLEPQAGQRAGDVALYLSDPLPALPKAAPIDEPADSPPEPAGTGAALLVVLAPETPPRALIVALAAHLVGRWFGPRAASLPFMVAGLAGHVVARLGEGPSAREAHGWVRERLAAGEAPALPLVDPLRGCPLVTAPRPGEAGAPGPGANLWATSFTEFLLETYGPEPLRRFLAATDPERRDHAALAAYQQPLGVLEELWLNSVRRGAGRGSALRSFAARVRPLIWRYWPQQLEVVFYMALGVGYSLAVPFATKYVIDTTNRGLQPGALLRIIGLLLLLYLVNSALVLRRAYLTSWVIQHVLAAVQERMFAHLQRLSHDFFGRAKIGDLMTRFSADLRIVDQAMSQVLGSSLYQLLVALAVAVTMIVQSPLLGSLVVLVVPLFAASCLSLRERFERVSREQQERAGEAAAAVQENLSAHAVVKAFGLEERTVAAYRARVTAQLRAALRLVVTGVLFETSLTMAITLAQLVVIGVGGYLAITGALTNGTLVLFIALLPALITPVAGLANVGQALQMASGSMERINELLEQQPSVADRPGSADLPPLAQEIRLERVDFSYESDRPVLRDLDLAIPAGSSVAIVGPSGSGKSTLASLLMRFWDPDSGRVLFDGRDLREVTLASLRAQIGIVFQDTFVFDSTLRENIAIGRPGAADAEVAAAARAARLEQYVASLPAGYETVLGERGVRMSGGQRQRLAIARALLRDPRVLILDEATSALDARTEAEILETLADAARGRTTISITHRLSMAATANRIFVLDEGRLVEQGTHAELVRAGGLYARLYQEQTGHVALGAAASELDRLRALPLFAAVDDAALAALGERLRPEQYPAGCEVVSEGEPGDSLYLIMAGEVEVLVDEAGGVARRVNSLTSGEYFGEVALLSGEPRTATVRTIVPTRVYRLARADFLALCEEEPALRRAVEETIARRRGAATSAARGEALVATGPGQS